MRYRTKPSETSLAHHPLARQLSSRAAIDRAEAAERIGLLGDPKFIPILERRLRDRSAEVRMHVVEALGRLEGDTSTALVGALKDRAELVRIEAIEALGSRQDKSTLDALRSALTDRSPLVRSYAAAAVGGMGGPADRKRLQTSLERETSDAARLGFLEGLWLLGDARSLDLALDLLESDDYRVRCATARALSGTFLSSRTATRIEAALRRRAGIETTVAPATALVGALKAVRAWRRRGRCFNT